MNYHNHSMNTAEPPSTFVKNREKPSAPCFPCILVHSSYTPSICTPVAWRHPHLFSLGHYREKGSGSLCTILQGFHTIPSCSLAPSVLPSPIPWLEVQWGLCLYPRRSAVLSSSRRADPPRRPTKYKGISGKYSYLLQYSSVGAGNRVIILPI